MNLRLLFIALPLALLGASACGDDGGHHGADGGYDCTTETRADTYVAGLEKIGALGYKFKLMDSQPAPPKKGDNDWTINIADSGDGAVTGAAVTVTPFMPDHGHGTPITAEVTEMGNGDYLASPVNLWMPGLWEVTVKVTDGGDVDEATFSMCIDI